VQGDTVQYHFVCLFPASSSSPHTIVELDGLKAAPVIHVVGKEDEGKEGEREEGGETSILKCGAKVLQREFLAWLWCGRRKKEREKGGKEMRSFRCQRDWGTKGMKNTMKHNRSVKFCFLYQYVSSCSFQFSL